MKDEGWIKVSDRGKVGEGERWYQGLMEETGWRGKGGGYRERRGLPYSPERSKSGHHSCSLYRAKIDTHITAMTCITSQWAHNASQQLTRRLKVDGNGVEKREGVAVLVLIVLPILTDNDKIAEDEECAAMAVLEAWPWAEVSTYLTHYHTVDKLPLRNG